VSHAFKARYLIKQGDSYLRAYTGYLDVSHLEVLSVSTYGVSYFMENVNTGIKRQCLSIYKKRGGNGIARDYGIEGRGKRFFSTPQRPD
jgi:hypothetical protein